MKIISLVENTSQKENIKSEHGLSLYIEACGKKILFDMGQRELFCENAKALGIDLSAVDIAIISHGHYDHGGGLTEFLKINKTAPVYIRKNAFLPYYNGEKYIGLDTALEQNERLIKTDGEINIGRGLSLAYLSAAPSDPGKLTLKQNGRSVTDSFDHEQYLLIEEKGKRVLISGCSHKGIIAIAEHFKPDIFIGGFHLMDMPLDVSLERCAERLNALNCDYYTCHCTGVLQYEFLTKYIKRISYLSAGEQIAIN